MKDQISKEEAIALLPEKDDIHTFMNPAGGMLIGADWSRESILEAINKYPVALSGPQAESMGHGLVIAYPDRYVFVETKEQEKNGRGREIGA